MRYGPKNLILTFDAKNLTHFGGVYLLYLFFKHIQLRPLLYQNLRFPQRNNRYSVAEEILALIYPISLGIGRIETTHLLRRNGVFQYLAGLPTYPNPTILRRFLLRMSPIALPKLRKLHNKLLLIMILKPKPPTRIIFDLDSTVLVLYGKQEMARIGYNPTKRGRPSYHPLLCFNGITKDFWHGELRPGDTHTATGTIELMIASFAKLPSSVKTVIIRADKGFYDHKTVEFLESKKALFSHCSKAHKTAKGKTFNFILPETFFWYRNNRVYIPTNGLEKETSVCGYKTPYTRRPYRATHPFLNGQIQLSDNCNQYETYLSQHMEVLQWSSLCRTYYQRTKRGLPPIKDSNKTFCSKRGLFSYPFIFLQSNKLVQTAVSAEGVSEYDA